MSYYFFLNYASQELFPALFGAFLHIKFALFTEKRTKSRYFEFNLINLPAYLRRLVSEIARVCNSGYFALTIKYLR